MEEQERVLEGEPIGTVVTRVNAIDRDGTFPNNQVYYYIKSNSDGERFFKRPSLCATTHFGYTFLDLESLTPMGKEPSWDIKNPLSKKFFILKKCPILMIL